MHMAPKDLRIRIIGAGMGGLTTALALARAGFTDIHVYEYASDLGFVGAGIQMAVNMARVLDRLGVWDDIASQSVLIKEASVVEGTTDVEKARIDLSYIPKTYSHPHCVGHRSALAGGLYKGCQREKAITFFFHTGVEDVDLSDASHPSFTAVPRDGTAQRRRVEADVLLAADGVKSPTRAKLLAALGLADDVQDTGQASYRILLTREQMQSDPALASLVDGDRVTRWIGSRRHIIAYPIANKSIYNVSTAQPDTNFAAAPSATYTTRGSKTAMLDVFADFCPRVQKMLRLVPEGEVCEWKLRVHAPLPTWVRGSTALLGDACHPTLPHMNQGAAQAVEDGAVLAIALAHLPDASPHSISKALGLYESIRKERAEALVALAAAAGRAMQLTDGEAKEERDRQFAALKQGKGPVPDRWADADTQKFAYADCVTPAERICREAFAAS